MLAYALRAAGRKTKGTPDPPDAPRQAVREKSHGLRRGHKQHRAHRGPREFDRVARKWNVDYAFYMTRPDKYLLLFKRGQADAITDCFSEYSRQGLDKVKTDCISIREQLRRAATEILHQPAHQSVKEVAHEDR